MSVFEPILFAALSAVVIAGGLSVVLSKAITASALAMGLSFLGMAGLFVMLGAETIGVFQVLIYVGAITILILYGVVMTQTPRRGASYSLFFQKQAGWAVVPLAFGGVFTTIVAFSLTSGPAQPRGGDLEPLANAVFREYAFPFEVASVLLLAAMVGAIVLVRRGED